MKKSILLDTQLLVLLVVGATSVDYIEKHKRLDAYAKADYALLLGLLDAADSIIVTPNTLTETVNLAKQINDPAKTQIAKTLQVLISSFTEQVVPSISAAARPEFLRLGLTDSVLIELAGENRELLTADLDLYDSVARAGLPVQNFNHLREAYL